jgi:hypothetical protein
LDDGRLNSERWDVLTCSVFEEQDILFYLEPSDLAPGLNAWPAALLNAWPAALKEWRKYQGRGGALDFKQWLSAERHADLTLPAITSAIQKLDRVPIEFLNLVDLVR